MLAHSRPGRTSRRSRTGMPGAYDRTADVPATPGDILAVLAEEQGATWAGESLTLAVSTRIQAEGRAADRVTFAWTLYAGAKRDASPGIYIHRWADHHPGRKDIREPLRPSRMRAAELLVRNMTHPLRGGHPPSERQADPST